MYIFDILKIPFGICSLSKLSHVCCSIKMNFKKLFVFSRIFQQQKLEVTICVDILNFKKQLFLENFNSRKVK